MMWAAFYIQTPPHLPQWQLRNWPCRQGKQVLGTNLRWCDFVNVECCVVGWTTPVCAPGIVEVGGGGGAVLLKFFLRSSPNPYRFFSSTMTLMEGLDECGVTSMSFPIVLARGIGVGKVAMLMGRLLRGGVAGTWKRVSKITEIFRYFQRLDYIGN
jgi:hypothetical protein